MASLQDLIEDLTPLGLDAQEARQLRALLIAKCPPQQTWRRISKEILTPHHPFQLHQALFKAVFSGWNVAEKGPIPVWIPASESICDTNLAALMKSFQGRTWEQGAVGDPQQDYALLHQISCEEPEVFWPQLLKSLRVEFATPPSRVYEAAENPDEGRWFPGGELNITAVALGSRNPDAPALCWAEEEHPTQVHTLSLGQLRRECEVVAAALLSLGLQPGARVAICMPMTREAVCAYLGTVLAGMCVVGVADSFSRAEIASRLRIAGSSLLVTQDVILRDGKSLPLYERAAPKSSHPTIVIPANPTRLQADLQPGDRSWQQFLEGGRDREAFRAHICDSEAATNILFSSGTTGEPKAIPWTHVTPLRTATDAFAQWDVRRGDVAAWPTNLGWMMGPFLIYAALLNGATIAIFNGSPLGRPFGEFVSAARVTNLGLVPSIVRAWRKADCIRGLDWQCVRCFASTGEASSPEDSLWLMAQAGYKPVIEVCGGTELGGAFLSGSLLQPQALSAFSTPTLGSRLHILVEEEGKTRQSAYPSLEPCLGELTVVPPFLGSSQRLLNADHNKVYFKGMPIAAGLRVPLRRHGDTFERLAGGFYTAHGRSDDTMNLGGIKVSSVELERVCAKNVDGIMESAAVAVPQAGGGPDSLVMFVVPSKPGSCQDLPDMKRRCQRAIREINPLFKLQQVVVVSALPRTASNKVMRRVLRARMLANSKM